MELLDVTQLVAARSALGASAETEGVHLTYLPFFVKACIEALRAVPEANSVVDEVRQVIALKQEYHIGIATSVPGGLVVPVVRHADQLNLLELAREIDRLVTAARERRSAPAGLVGRTFTITGFGGPSSVVRHADQLNLLELAREIDRLVTAARERRSAPAGLVGSTFTITSFGGLPGGALFATPILNYPEVAILGLGRIELQPRVVDGAVGAGQC